MIFETENLRQRPFDETAKVRLLALMPCRNFAGRLNFLLAMLARALQY